MSAADDLDSFTYKEIDYEKVPTVLEVAVVVTIAVFVLIIAIDFFCSARCHHSNISYATIETGAADPAAVNNEATSNINPPQYRALFTPSDAAHASSGTGSTVSHNQPECPPINQTEIMHERKTVCQGGDYTDCNASPSRTAGMASLKNDKDCLMSSPKDHKDDLNGAGCSKDAINNITESRNLDLSQTINNSMEKR